MSCFFRIQMALGLFVWSMCLAEPAAGSDVEVNLAHGTADWSGSQLPVEILFDQQGRFVVRLGGWADQITGYDGNSLWRVESGTGPCDVNFLEKELLQVLFWTLNENWQSLDEITIQADTLTIEGGRLTFRIDRSGQQIDRLTAVNSPGGESITPGRTMTLQSDFRLNSVTLESVEAVRRPANWFARPAWQARGVSFDKNSAAEIEVRQSKSGHLFVRPTLDGQDVGWFLFDSGATGSHITPELADQLDFPEIGQTMTGGVGGKTGMRPVRQGRNLQLGPLRMDEIKMVATPSSRKASQLLGEPVAGVLGWDILLRAVVEIDMREGKIAIHEPGQFSMDPDQYQPLFLHWQVPYVQCTFEGDRQGLFLIDTGAGNRGPIFHSLAVARLNLLDGRPTRSGSATGAGGAVSLQTGQLDWFEIAGHRTEQVETAFLQGADGESDLYTEGFLGGRVIRPFRLLFDYGNQRVGFVPR